MKKTIDKYKKEELELLSYKDITKIILDSTPGLNTAELFTKIKDLLGFTKKEYEDKIGDYYTSLTTDKHFIMLDDGTWDLSKRHKSKKLTLDEDDEDDDLEDIVMEEEGEGDEYDNIDEDNYEDDEDDDIKDLVIIDEDELDQE